uniref:Uncharacterized protein n=1 Tax=Gallus gallus TaxID=9031 RepID=A0A8V1A5F5_CHICK
MAQWGTVGHSTKRYGTVWHSGAQWGTAQSDMAQYGTVGHSTKRYGIVWHSGAQHGVAHPPCAATAQPRALPTPLCPPRGHHPLSMMSLPQPLRPSCPHRVPSPHLCSQYGPK